MFNKVLFIDSVHPLIKEELTAHGFQCDYFPEYGRSEFLKIIGDYFGIIIRSKIMLDHEFLSLGGQLKFIGRVGAGMENIDLDFAIDNGIQCFNSPEGNRDAVAEHAVGMLLSLFNNINRADRQVRSGQWIREGNRGIELKGKTVGIIGYGNMGSAFAQRLKGFDVKVISYDKYKHNYTDGNTLKVSMEEIHEQSDIISLHVPFTEETKYLVDGSFLEKFEKKIVLVNTARGAVVNTSDLVQKLKEGKVTAAALDVLEYEDKSFENLATNLPKDFQYLLKAENVILTPHIAGWTVESNIKLARVLVEKIIAAFPVA
ncbi:MAG: NAD(P)-dependent oxidoreductase [Bacteroidota bacterium]